MSNHRVLRAVLAIGTGASIPAVATADPSGAQTADAPHSTPAQLVDALHGAFGHHHARAVHAKGLILEGKFEPAGGAARLTKAAHLQKTASQVVVRFSDFTGIPDIADNTGAANPRGFAIRFTLPNGTSTDIVAHSFNGFPAPTTDQFRELLLAIAASGATAPKPTALDRFLTSHPVAKTFLSTQKTPASYASITYFGVNAFQFTNAAGQSRYVRYRFVPTKGEKTLTAAEAAAKSANYLSEEIKARIAERPFSFDMYAQLAETGDQIDDPSVAWPETRQRVRLGRITVTKLSANTPEQDQALAFDPARLPDGIKPADPMIEFRSQAYPISVKERQSGGTAARATPDAPSAPREGRTPARH